jgi:formylglycine-generating enzyme required for sulfatase activity
MASLTTTPARTFISYSRADSKFALSLAEDLRAAGLSIWMDQFDIPVGANWDRAVEAGLASCGQFLVVLSPSSVTSDNVRAELNFALAEGKKIIPVLHQDCKRPISIYSRQYADFTADYQTAFTELRRVLAAAVEPTPSIPAEPPSEQSAQGKPPAEEANCASAQVPVTGVGLRTLGRLGLPAPSAKVVTNQRPPSGGPPTDRRTLPAPRVGEIKVNSKDGLTYVWIPPGSFRMGRSPGDSEVDLDDTPRRVTNEKPHQVTISRGFWIGQTPVTQEAYWRVTGQAPSHFKGDRRPVEMVNWHEAQTYCQAVGMRLPTEQEWEYAARAGSTSARYGDLDAVAWYEGNSGGQTHEVGQKQANAWGLCDILGNVWEWTASDCHSREKLVRGGSWFHDPGFIRVSYRLLCKPDLRLTAVGFRCVEE